MKMIRDGVDIDNHDDGRLLLTKIFCAHIWRLVPSSMTVIMAPVLLCHWAATLTRDNAFHRLCLNFTKSNELFPPTIKCSLSHHQWPLIAASGLHIEQLWMMGKNHKISTLNIEQTTFDETKIPISCMTAFKGQTNFSQSIYYEKLNQFHWVCSFAMNLCFA